MLKIICPRCKCEVEISEDKLGEVVTCDFCKTSFVAESPSGKDISSASPLSDGTFREVEVDGVFYSLKMLRQLNRRFIAFSSLFLLEIICFIAMVFHMRYWIEYPPFRNRGSVASVEIAFCMILLAFISLFVSYFLLLKSLRKFDFSFAGMKVALYLYWLGPVVLLISVIVQALHFYPVLLAIPVFIVDIGCRIICFTKAAMILKSAREVVPSGGKPFIGMMRRCSFVLFPLFVSLIALVFFFGSKGNETSLCKNCGIRIDSDIICFFEKKLQSFPEYEQTAYSRFLDPDCLCFHHDGNVVRSKKEFFFPDFLIQMKPIRKILRHIVFSVSSDPEERRKAEVKENVKKYLDDPANIRPDSKLYRYLCEKNSQSLARRMIVFDLTSEELDDFHRDLIGAPIGAKGEIIGSAHEIKDAME